MCHESAGADLTSGPGLARQLTHTRTRSRGGMISSIAIALRLLRDSAPLCAATRDLAAQLFAFAE
jgi:hypothetical protein